MGFNSGFKGLTNYACGVGVIHCLTAPWACIVLQELINLHQIGMKIVIYYMLPSIVSC